MNKLLRYPLSGEDIQKLIGSKSKIMSYTELYNYKDRIFDLLKKHNKIAILYPITPKNQQNRFGHWCGLKYTPSKNMISFMDSYGDVIDKQIDYIPKEGQNNYPTEYKYLISELLKVPKNIKIEYNHHQFQSDNQNIATCGRHTALFLNSKYLVDDYIKWYKALMKKHKLNADKLSVILTS